MTKKRKKGNEQYICKKRRNCLVREEPDVVVEEEIWEKARTEAGSGRRPTHKGEAEARMTQPRGREMSETCHVDGR